MSIENGCLAPPQNFAARSWGIPMSSHCCVRMNEAVAFACVHPPDRFDCPDCLVNYTPQFDEYGLIVHDGGASCVGILFCPWCGAKLP